MIGLVQATEAVKLLVGFGDPLIGRLLTFDALGMRFREVKLRRDPNCPLCGKTPTITDLSIHAEGAGQACAIGDNGPTHAFGVGAPSAAVGAPAAKPGS
ncbi:MAG: hypothetical protein A3I03_15380 [Candidatus Rokubacteria bacterium RIFCSPLOWO2_02_FULL_68_19]|nr:MAG: hypothetical protein A3I03_15380 [Candidatus Rokubacteria bacterium RIFCSPLOWO2_02_FULL_68_19]